MSREFTKLVAGVTDCDISPIAGLRNMPWVVSKLSLKSSTFAVLSDDDFALCHAFFPLNNPFNALTQSEVKTLRPFPNKFFQNPFAFLTLISCLFLFKHLFKSVMLSFTV